jgi:uncharacterized cupin superfamily protein
MGKPYVRLYPIDIARLPWQQVGTGAPAGIQQKILVTDPDKGSVTRLLKAEPKVDQGIFVHEHWEEVYILEGSCKLAHEYHPAGTYTCKSPGIEHGPILTDTGFVNLEFRDYHIKSMSKPFTRLYPIDIQRLPWEQIEGTPGIQVRVLVRDPGTGSETLLLQVKAGTEILYSADERCEEMYILEGSCKIGNEFYPMGSYICWPPWLERGPLYSGEGLLALAIRNRI